MIPAYQFTGAQVSSMSLDELIDNFDLLDDWEDRYRYLIQLGRKLPTMADSDKSEESRVQGCMSQVWLVCRPSEALPTVLHFVADSDAHIVKGLIAVLMTAYSGKSPQAILEVNLDDLFERLHLHAHLSPNRRNGFLSMIERIRHLASYHLHAMA